MKKKDIVKGNYIITGIITVCFILYTIVIKNSDVRAVGEYGSVVGFADFNEFFYNKIGYSPVMYKISEVFGYFSLLLVGVFGLIGLLQLIKGKSLKKVDPAIYVLGGGYVMMGALYVLFEKLVINLRPVIVDVEEGLEASYPSSHTFLAIFVCLSAFVMYSFYIKDKKICLIAKIATIGIMILAILTRFLSGAHWATDIVGSLLLGTALFSLFVSVLNTVILLKQQQ